MKLNMKLVAAAVALVAAGSANATLTLSDTGSSTLGLIAFSTSTNAYYVRDLGYTLNQFLPTGVTTVAGDGGVSGNKTPAAGLTLDKTTNANFADASFSTWLASQTAADIRWTIIAGDSLSNGTTTGVARTVLTSLVTAPTTFSNGAVAAAATSFTQFGSAANAGWTGTISSTGDSINTFAPAVVTNFALGVNTLSSLDQAANVYYFTRTQGTGALSTAANQLQFGNSAGAASFKLASNGDVTYAVAPAAVPLPAAAWFLGSGVLGLFGVGRRKAKAQAAV